jgi:hypothetical protein
MVTVTKIRSTHKHRGIGKQGRRALPRINSSQIAAASSQSVLRRRFSCDLRMAATAADTARDPVVVRVARRTFLLPAQRLPLTALPHREPVPGSASCAPQNLEQHGKASIKASSGQPFG